MQKTRPATEYRYKYNLDIFIGYSTEHIYKYNLDIFIGYSTELI